MILWTVSTVLFVFLNPVLSRARARHYREVLIVTFGWKAIRSYASLLFAIFGGEELHWIFHHFYPVLLLRYRYLFV